VISSGTSTQTVTLTAAAAINATSLTITTVTPTANFAAGSTVTYGQSVFIQAASLGTGSAGAISGQTSIKGNVGNAFNLSSDSSFGTLTTALVSGTSYTNLAVTAVTDPIPQGANITIGGNAAVTQTAVTTAAVAAGATSIPSAQSQRTKLMQPALWWASRMTIGFMGSQSLPAFIYAQKSMSSAKSANSNLWAP